MDLLLHIARCPIVEHCLAQPAGSHPCSEIVLSQEAPSPGEHQIPEPWSGHLARAPILFLSSNPSVSFVEDYPVMDWGDQAIVDYFENRFAGGRKPWIKDGIYGLNRDGTHARTGTAFWKAVRNRAAELLERPARAVVPGEDYALTEIVHCKSRGERGVAAATATCADRYLAGVVGASGARVVVCLGKVAADAVRRSFAIPTDATVHGPIDVGSRPRHFTFLPHPASWTKKTFATCLTLGDVGALRDALGA